MRRLRAFARTVEPVVHGLLGLTLLALLIKTLVLDALPAPYTALHELGGLMDTLLRSLFGGTIFYITVTSTKTYIDRKRLAPWLDRRLLRIVSRHRGLVNALRASAEASIAEDMGEVLKRVKSTDPAPDSIYTSRDWGIYLQHYAEGIGELAGQVGKRGSFMDSDILRAVTELENCDFLELASALPKVVSKPVAFSTFEGPFGEYEVLMQQLEQFRERLERRYGLERSDRSPFIGIEFADEELQDAVPQGS